MTEPAQWPPYRAAIHTLDACPGGGCQAVHIDHMGFPIDAESAALGRLTKHESGWWLCQHGRYYAHCPEAGCVFERFPDGDPSQESARSGARDGS